MDKYRVIDVARMHLDCGDQTSCGLPMADFLRVTRAASALVGDTLPCPACLLDVARMVADLETQLCESQAAHLRAETMLADCRAVAEGSE